MTLSDYTFSLPPRKVPLSRSVVTLVGFPVIQLFIWGWICLCLVFVRNSLPGNMLFNPSGASRIDGKDFYTYKYAYTNGTLTTISNSKINNKDQAYALYYSFHANNQQFTGIFFKEGDKPLPQIGDKVKIYYRMDNPIVSYVVGIQTSSVNQEWLFISCLMLLVGVGILTIYTVFNKKEDYLMKYGHLAVGKFNQQIEDKNSDGELSYRVQYKFMAFDNQYYYAEENRSLPAYEEDVVILYNEGHPKDNLILKVHKLYEQYDVNFQPLPASWDEVFYHSVIPAGVIISQLFLFISH
ncbi:hypothetical protein [Xanthocytophaga agilis]|uniref:DUF3592 domain-containing protein n=1 Tax=Xanthocytophaga agilis TaxID=3048010 RepID=A0AAE3R2G6_9BACT|nr:hypothetical protein [Xanthocytophaga agilis]MDJ1499462.1 hypothetical protein [Xanthocytophaga agilis]